MKLFDGTATRSQSWRVRVYAEDEAHAVDQTEAYADASIQPPDDTSAVQITVVPTPMAPWPDFLGSPLWPGDTIIHPGGEVGEILYLQDVNDEEDRWRVKYADGTLSRLALQIGEKGRAVRHSVCTTPPVPIRITRRTEASIGDRLGMRSGRTGFADGRKNDPVIQVEINVAGKTFVEDMEVSMDGLAAAIVDRALKMTDANDRSDAAGDATDKFDPNDRCSEVLALEKAIEDGDADYNAEKAKLLGLCRLMASARLATKTAAGGGAS